MRKSSSYPKRILRTIPGLVALCLLLAIQAAAVVVNGTTVSGNQVTITGTGFATPLTVTLNGTKLAVVSNTPTQIIATMNPVPAPGTYRLVVKAGTPSTTTYVAISAASNIVARVSLVGQTALVSPTTILTPTVDSLYRISVYLVQPFPVAASCSGNACGFVQPLFQWTDDGGTQITIPNTGGIALGATCPQPPGPGSYCAPSLGGSALPGFRFLVRANADTPIIYSTTGNIGSGVSYDFFMTVEQLQ